MSFLKYTAPAYASRLFILLVDIGIVFFSIHVASLLRHNFELANTYGFFAIPILIVLLVRILSFKWFRTYAVIVRYVGASDLMNVFMAIAGGSMLLLGLSVLLRPYGVHLSISILFIEFFLSLTLLSLVRLVMPVLYRFIFDTSEKKENVIIIGGGQLGAMTRNVLRQDRNADFNLVGIVDDNKSITKKYLDGIPVYLPDSIEQLVKDEQITKAIFAIQKISNKRKNELVDICINQGIKVLQVPFQSSWNDGEFNANQIKEIQIEDLLNREVISLDEKMLFTEYEDKVVMITGGAGSIGSELIRQIIKFKPKKIILLDQAETPTVNIDLECREDFDYLDVKPIIADVRDLERLELIFKIHCPEIIFHAAAYKHVPIMEAYPMEAISVNVKGTKQIADLAHEYKVEKFVMVSTDKAVNPTNVMGASKRIAEIYIQSLNKESNTKFITTRFGNVLGSNGSVVPRFKKQIAKGGPITVTHENITRYFMTIPEASLLVLEAGAMGQGGEIFLFDMGEPVKIVDLAKKMIQLSGFKPNVDIEIKITGLRPGEKLYEELLSSKENSLSTHHPKITKAKVREVGFDDAQSMIEDLIESITTENDMIIVGKMKSIVPEFISNNSVFNKIDKTVSV